MNCKNKEEIFVHKNNVMLKSRKAFIKYIMKLKLHYLFA
jgi:hypothetical protein